MFSSQYRFYWFIILFTGLLLRVYHLNLPLLESQPNRQIMDAFMIRQLYRPQEPLQVDFSLLGFPLYHSLAVGLYHLWGSENLIFGRLISVFSSLASLWFFVLISRSLTSEKISLWASFFFFILSPINLIMARAVQIDQLTLATSLATTYFLMRQKYWLSLGLFALTLAQHATSAHLALPLLAIFYFGETNLLYSQIGFFLFKRISVWGYFLASIGLAGLWYVVMFKLNQTVPGGGWIEALDPRIWISLNHLLSVKFWANAFYNFTDWTSTVISLPFFLLGWFSRPVRPYALFYAWFFGAVLSLIYRSQPAITTSYYFLAFVPPFAVFAAKGVNLLLRQFNLKSLTISFRFFLLILAVTTVVSTWRSYIFNLYTVHWKHTQVLEAALRVQQLTPKSAKVIATSYSSGALQFYLDRVSRSLVIVASQEPENPTIMEFYQLKHWGAEYYVISDITELDKNPLFKAEIFRYPVVFTTDKILLVKLTP